MVDLTQTVLKIGRPSGCLVDPDLNIGIVKNHNVTDCVVDPLHCILYVIELLLKLLLLLVEDGILLCHVEDVDVAILVLNLLPTTTVVAGLEGLQTAIFSSL